MLFKKVLYVCLVCLGFFTLSTTCYNAVGNIINYFITIKAIYFSMYDLQPSWRSPISIYSFYIT